MRHGRADGDLIVGRHDVGVDLDGHVVGRVADEHVVEKQIVVVHLIVFDDLLAELAHELCAVHDTVGAERDDEPDVLLRHAGGTQLRDDGLGDGLARRRAGDVVDGRHHLAAHLVQRHRRRVAPAAVWRRAPERPPAPG